MWDRKELKARAKDVLRTSYWKAFLASFILAIAAGGLNPSGYSSTSDSSVSTGTQLDWVFLGVILAVMSFGLLFAFAFRIFLGFPLEVGANRYFKQSAEDQTSLNDLGYSFTNKRYWLVVKAMLLKGFLNFLWYLLLIIPGIVKSIAYSLVPFILADNPNIGARRAVELSNQMTRGHKFRIFVLHLSFLGWILLGTLACFVGVLFVMPYINATRAELYLKLRELALANGLTTSGELQLAPPPPPPQPYY
ncbi:DUF975 family protein [Paenibacillus sp. GCM10027627]|uniref:DUF975 family protein n=1 Tax=unclassified Paenibacillus TaxID=185978 RepID=UPI00362F5EAE